MSEGKLQVTIGSLAFSAEGEISWVTQQFDKVLKAAPDLTRSLPSASRANPRPPDEDGEEFSASLASYLREKKAETNQVKRFLATADWLRRRGTSELTTAAVSKALSDNHQKRLGNPADSLNKNVSKGHCEKRGNGFFITPDGLRELGYE